MRAIKASVGVVLGAALVSAVVLRFTDRPLLQQARVAVAAPAAVTALPAPVTVEPKRAPVDAPVKVVDLAREAYLLSQVAQECEAALALYEKLGEQIETFAGCAKYLTEPLPDWRSLLTKALEGRDLLARLSVQLSQWMEKPDDKVIAQEFRETIREAQRSNDPEVQYVVAMYLLTPAIAGPDPTAGLAMLIRACGALGCSLEDPRFGQGCIEDGSCSSGMTVLDHMEQAVGAGMMQAAAEFNKQVDER